MIRLRCFALTGLIVLLANAPAFCGETGGKGGDQHSWDYGAAWYGRLTRSINVCTEVARGFPVDEKDLHDDIAEVFQVWAQYMKVNSIPAPSYGAPRLMAACDGTEDLKIYFGESSNPTFEAQITEAKKKYEDPVSFAELTKPDHRTGAAKGYVWVGSFERSGAVPYPREYAFGIMMHELGHVFGCDHVTGTIMDENITFALSSTELWGGRQMTVEEYHAKVRSIDFTRQLYGSPVLASFKGVFPVNALISPSDLFRRLAGRVSSGYVRASLDASDPKGSLKLSLIDQAGTETFPISAPQFEAVTTGDEMKVFQTAVTQSIPGGFTQSDQVYPGGVVMIGNAWLTPKTGSKIPVLVRYNGIHLWSITMANPASAGDRVQIFYSIPLLQQNWYPKQPYSPVF